MSESKHTPGPWEWRDNERTGSGVELVGRSGPVLDIYESHGGGDRPNEANARLIAAAPDLLGALRHLLEQPQLQGEQAFSARGAIDRARAAIAKAEGR